MRQSTTRSLAAVLSLMILVFGTCSTAALAQRAAATMEQDDCLAGWSAPFGGDGGVNDRVWTIVEFDDGSGPALYAGGEFTNAGGVTVNSIARWDGEKWESLGGGITAQLILSLAVFDDGSGPALYVAGGLNITDIPGTTGIARWDGNEWSSVGGGMDGGVTQLHVADDGTGPALYAGGNFTAAGGVEANRIARWDGTQWSALGEGVSGGNVNAIATFDDGSGPAVYVAGFFTEAGGKPVNFIAKWDGKNWFDVGGGTNDTIYALTAFNDSSGDALYAGGSFTDAGGVNAQRVARWDGEEWSNVGLGVSGTVYALTGHFDGETTLLYAGGSFTAADGAAANRLTRWDGTSWSSLENGVNNTVRTLYSSPLIFELYIGGDFEYASSSSIRAPHILRWKEERLLAIGETSTEAVVGLRSFDSGYGPELYVGLSTGWLGGGLVPAFGKWDGQQWSQLGDGPASGGVLPVIEFDDGSGPALFVAGVFSTIGELVTRNIAKWDGEEWSSLDGGFPPGTNASQVTALATYDNGDGAMLYAGGNFTQDANGQQLARIAGWNGQNWFPLGEGLNQPVWALQSFDDGSGNALYAGGFFTTADGNESLHVARWDGKSWSPVGPGLNSWVRAMAIFDDGSGPALYVGGNFTATGDGQLPLMMIARWDGKQWSDVGGGVNAEVWAFEVFEDCSGPALYVAGKFTTAGDDDANQIARWDGTSWSALGCGIEGEDPGVHWGGGVYSLATHLDDDGPALYVGGNFYFAGGQPAGHIARWEGERRVADLNFDCIVDGSDLLLLLSAWGECPENASCPGDLSGDGVVDGVDLLILLSNWG